MIKDAVAYTVAMKADGSLPSEIQLIPYGSHKTDKGDFVLDEEAIASVMSDLEGRENDMVIDYEHQTLYGGEAPAAGWITKLVNKGKDGLWALVEWTDRAAGYLKNREYRYLSPVFLKRQSDGRVTKLINAALTNQPAIDGMVPLVNKAALGRKEQTEVSEMEKLLKLLGLAPDATEEMAMKAVMELQAGVVLVAHKDALAVLELAEDSKLEDVITALSAMKADAEGMARLRKDLELAEGAPVSEITGTVMAMKQTSGQAGDLVVQLASLKARLDGKDAEGLVAQAMKDGKIALSQKDWALEYASKDPESFKVFIAKSPQVVPLGEKAGGGAPGAAAGGFESQEDAMIAKQLGVTPEQRKKFGPGAGEEAA